MSKRDETAHNIQFTGPAFELLAFEHLTAIFPLVQKEVPVQAGEATSIDVDIAARSENGRLILFEVKYVREGKSLPRSVYLSMAALKDSVSNLFPKEPPVIALLSNVEVDDTVRSTFARSGIPIVALGVDSEQTKERLRSAFRELSIIVPELSAEEEFAQPSRGYCFIAMPHRPESETIYEVIRAAVEKAGYKSVSAWHIFSPSVILEKIRELISRSEVVVADVSNSNPNVLFEVGLAMGSNKNVILITRERQIPYDVQALPLIHYDLTLGGLDRLSSLLGEILVAFQNRQSSI
jgi:hypothetical protein